VLRLTRRALAIMVVLTCVVGGTSVLGATLSATPASAALVCAERKAVGGFIKCVRWVEDSSAGTPADSGGSNAPPPCPLSDFPESYHDDKPGRTSNFCVGDDVCYTTNVFVPIRNPEGDKPKDDSEARVMFCFVGPNASHIRDIFWSDDEEPPSLQQQAQIAVDQLQFATPTVGISPAGRTLVNLDTWFWLDGVQREVTAKAFTLTATARLRSMSVDPGDGSPAFRCDNIVTSASEAEGSCVHRYRKASVRGATSVEGRPAYGATITTVYDLSYTDGGDPVEIPGAQASIDGTPASTAVLVTEVQTLTRPNR
jgi:hypothetical protein